MTTVMEPDMQVLAQIVAAALGALSAFLIVLGVQRDWRLLAVSGSLGAVATVALALTISRKPRGYQAPEDALFRDLRDSDAPFATLADFLQQLPQNAERINAVRAVLEARDAARRSQEESGPL